MCFKIRLGGANEFVSAIDPDWPRASPPGKVDFVKGWDNQDAKKWKNLGDAEIAAAQVWDIEGFHTVIEPILVCCGPKKDNA